VGVILLTIGSSSTFETSTATSVSSDGAADRRGNGRAYISVAEEGDEGENIFR
jgi:hypothetical protein